MSDAIQSILSQIQSISSRTEGPSLDRPHDNSINFDRVMSEVSAKKVPGFTETVGRMMEGVSSAQHNAGELARAFELGDPRADLARVMVAQQQAGVAFRASVEVRNRLVQAYQDVIHMSI